MLAGRVFQAEVLANILNNADIPLIGDAAGIQGSAAAGSLYLSLHSADAGETGDQSTSEITYTSYARVPIARDGTKWTIDVPTGVATNAEVIAPPKCTGGSAEATHFMLGTASSGTGKQLFRGELASPLLISNNVLPTMAPGTLTVSAN